MRHPRRLGHALLLAALAASACVRGSLARWTPPAIASGQWESHPAFDPWTGDLYFVRGSPAFEGWHLLVARCTPGGWAAPQPPPFAAPGLEADPAFAEGGRALYFISSRGEDGGAPRADLDVFRVERTDAGTWGAPRRLPPPVSSPDQEWFPRPGADGWLYLGSSRPGGLGKNDLWRVREQGDGGWAVENLGPELNTAGQEYEAEPSADGRRLVLSTDLGLFESERAPDGGWTPRRPLGPPVGLDPTDVGPLGSPRGSALLFSRDSRGPGSGELFLWRRSPGEPRWPPGCPPR